MPRATLSANERIKNNQEITTLIQSGQAFFSAPYKVFYTWQPTGDVPIRVAFSVPKKRLSKAVHRNRIKRLSKEAFRLQKAALVVIAQENNKQLQLLFVYQHTKLIDLATAQSAIEKTIEKILSQHG